MMGRCPISLSIRSLRHRRGRRSVLSRRAQRGAGAGRRRGRRAGAGAGRRRHRQDAGADDAAGAYPGDPPRLSRRAAGRHLHQQGGARDARAAGGDDRSRRRRCVARHLPCARRAHPAPSRRGGRAQIELHDPRHRRPAPPPEADPRRRQYRRAALAGAGAARGHRALEGSRADPRQGLARPRSAISPTAARSTSTGSTRSASRR